MAGPCQGPWECASRMTCLPSTPYAQYVLLCHVVATACPNGCRTCALSAGTVQCSACNAGFYLASGQCTGEQS